MLITIYINTLNVYKYIHQHIHIQIYTYTISWANFGDSLNCVYIRGQNRKKQKNQNRFNALKRKILPNLQRFKAINSSLTRQNANKRKAISRLTLVIIAHFLLLSINNLVQARFMCTRIEPLEIAYIAVPLCALLPKTTRTVKHCIAH